MANDRGAIDGVYVRDKASGRLVFHGLGTPKRAEVADVAARKAAEVLAGLGGADFLASIPLWRRCCTRGEGAEVRGTRTIASALVFLATAISRGPPSNSGRSGIASATL